MKAVKVRSMMARRSKMRWGCSSGREDSEVLIGGIERARACALLVVGLFYVLVSCRALLYPTLFIRTQRTITYVKGLVIPWHFSLPRKVRRTLNVHNTQKPAIQMRRRKYVL